MERTLSCSLPWLEFIAVDVVEDSLEECARQVAAVCDTPVRRVHVAVSAPEEALARVALGSCDLFVCVYVIELLPSREHDHAPDRRVLGTGGGE